MGDECGRGECGAVMLTSVDVPEGVSGGWRVERFTVSDRDAKWESMRGRYIRPGTYTRLMRGRHCVMSDTPAEMHDHSGFVYSARGRVLLAGLGIGMVLQNTLDKPEVKSATVVEIDPDVIALVAPHYQAKYGDCLEVVNADIFAWRPPKGEFWDCAWFDIWDDICSDNLKAMGMLGRRFARCTGSRGFWSRELCRYYARRGQ